jgi:signal transduction histidine kinase
MASVGIVTVGALTKLQINRRDTELAQVKKLIRQNLHTKSAQLSQAHASALGILAADNALTDIQQLVQSTVSNDDDVVYGVVVKTSGATVAFSAPGHIEGDVERTAATDILKLTPRDVERLLPGREERTRFGQPVVEYSAPIKVGEELYGNLFYGVSTKKVELAAKEVTAEHERALRLTLIQLSLVILGVTILAIPLALRRARSLVRPIVQLTQAAQRLAHGQHDVRVEIRSGDELETLGESFNTMVTELERSYAELEASNRMLHQEILERKRAEEERTKVQRDLFQSQKMDAIGQLAGGVAHDFNNLLAVIQGNLDLMASSKSAEDSQEMARDIASAVAHGVTLTRQLLTFSRKQPNEPKLIAPAQIVRNVQKLIRRLLSEQYELKVKVEESQFCIMMDPGRLEQVVINLTLNARDSMKGRGKIAIEGRKRYVSEQFRANTGLVPSGDYFELVVEDNGCGMSQEVIGRIFEPFFTTKEPGKGTGLGLATVHGIVGEANGFIVVQSIEGRGTSFFVLFPLIPVELEEPKPESIKLASNLGEGHSIVLCEDETAVREIVARILSSKGYQVAAFDRPSKVLAYLDGIEREPDLLISDVIMPEQNGKELAMAAKKRFPLLQVLFISGYTDGVLKEQGIDDVGSHLIKKPFIAKELLERVASMIESRFEK